MTSNFEVTTGPTGGLIKSWTRGVDFAENAKQQLLNISQLPFIHKHVAAMPDVHLGFGATVGSVIATRGAIIPAAVGVDIGCGMMAVKLPIKASQLPDNLAALRSDIERVIPHGRTDNGGRADRGAWHDVPDSHDGWLYMLQSRYYQEVLADHPKAGHKSVARQLGTLGTGNHFVEVCVDEGETCRTCMGACYWPLSGMVGNPDSCPDCNGKGKTDPSVWLMLHSGSRGPGNAIGSYFIEKAKELMAKFFISLPDKDLAYLPQGTKLYEDYVKAVSWAQDYARVNRELMMMAAIGSINRALHLDLPVTLDAYPQAINAHHNYVAMENHFGANVQVTRKGAVRARLGDMGIIPGSMGTRSYIVCGKGNPDSFNSCSHGAGRKMSRTEANKKFTVEDHIKATEGVECRKDKDVLDETPGAYKPIDDVMAAQSDLVDVVAVLKQIVCVKG